MASQEKGTKKRKRTRNTSADQYEMYINLLESDSTFRSGIINPTLEDNYIQKKWQQLTELLNSSPEGPHMGIEEWKKRFSDWKYGVRAKARKIIEHQNKTGSGPPQSEIKLSPMEDKALSLWGKVVVTGTPLIDSYDGFPSIINELPVTFEINDDITIECTTQVLDEINCTPQILKELNSTPQVPNELISVRETEHNSPNKAAPKKPLISKPLTRVRHRPKPLSALAEKLIDISTNSEHNQEKIINTLNNCFKDYMKHKIEEHKLQQTKLNFEIAKYKFENPNFSFE